MGDEYKFLFQDKKLFFKRIKMTIQLFKVKILHTAK